jgi:hypothetical protein
MLYRILERIQVEIIAQVKGFQRLYNQQPPVRDPLSF